MPRRARRRARSRHRRARTPSRGAGATVRAGPGSSTRSAVGKRTSPRAKWLTQGAPSPSDRTRRVTLRCVEGTPTAASTKTKTITTEPPTNPSWLPSSRRSSYDGDDRGARGLLDERRARGVVVGGSCADVPPAMPVMAAHQRAVQNPWWHWPLRWEGTPWLWRVDCQRRDLDMSP